MNCYYASGITPIEAARQAEAQSEITQTMNTSETSLTGATAVGSMRLLGAVMLDCGGDYKVGDPMPDGYIQRQEWAEVHLKAGLKQEQCDSCCLWHFPHELSETRRVWYAETRDRHHRYTKVKMISRICKVCETKQAPNAAGERPPTDGARTRPEA